MMFLRVTQAVSRQQEYAADALASRVVGARALIDGLKKIRSSALVYDYYWQQEISPVLRAGYHPPLAQGFASYLQTPAITEAMDEVVERSMEEAKASLYDTHPPIKKRIEAASGYPPGPEMPDEEPAISVLERLPALETELFEMPARMNNVGKLKPVAWEDVGKQVYLPAWQEFVKRESSSLRGITPAALPEIASNMNEFSKMFPAKEAEQRRSQAQSLLGAALAVGLYN